MHVLLVEDDRELQELYSLALNRAKIEVTLAAEAQAALDRLEESEFDLLIIDMLLPMVNGLNILHELRTYDDWRQIPIIVLSNLSTEELGVSSRHESDLGITRYLKKSETKPAQLVREIKALILHPTDANL